MTLASGEGGKLACYPFKLPPFVTWYVYYQLKNKQETPNFKCKPFYVSSSSGNRSPFSKDLSLGLPCW